MAKCGLPCEIFSRVTGYYRPIRNFNLAKKEEFKDRKYYDINKAMQSFQKRNAKKTA